jgi:hypothetical protein
MSDDDRAKAAKRHVEHIDKLFGDVAEMGDDEVNELFASIDSADPAEIVRNVASRAAQQYRLNNQQVPPHVRSALNATKLVIQGASMSRLRQIVADVTSPLSGPAREVSYSYRNKTELTEHDRMLLDDCSREVLEDWSEGKSE